MDRKFLAMSAVAVLLAGVVIGLLLRGGKDKQPGAGSPARQGAPEPPPPTPTTIAHVEPACPREIGWIDFLATRPTLPQLRDVVVACRYPRTDDMETLDHHEHVFVKAKGEGPVHSVFSDYVDGVFLSGGVAYNGTTFGTSVAARIAGRVGATLRDRDPIGKMVTFMEYEGDLGWELTVTDRPDARTIFRVFDDRVLREALPHVVGGHPPFCGRRAFDSFLMWHDWRSKNPGACPDPAQPARPAPPRDPAPPPAPAPGQAI